MRHAKGVTLEEAEQTVKDPLYFGNLMVREGKADGSVAGATNTTAHTVAAALRCIGVREGMKTVSSFFLMVVPDKSFGAERRDDLCRLRRRDRPGCRRTCRDRYRLGRFVPCTFASRTARRDALVLDKRQREASTYRKSRRGDKDRPCPNARPRYRRRAPGRRRTRQDPSAIQKHPAHLSPAVPTSSSSPTSTPETSPTNSPNASPAAPPSAPSSKASTAPATTSHAAAKPKTSSTPSRSRPFSRRRERRSLLGQAGAVEKDLQRKNISDQPPINTTLFRRAGGFSIGDGSISIVRGKPE